MSGFDNLRSESQRVSPFLPESINRFGHRAKGGVPPDTALMENRIEVHD
jgi:hypothetical protein